MIGVLAVQGAFIEHRRMLEKLGEETFEIRRRADWEDHAPGSNAPMEGLVLPGGESTVMEKLLRELGLFEPLKRYIEGGGAVMGTCAGMILLARTVISGGVTAPGCFAAMDMTVVRNAYGRQLGSFQVDAPFAQWEAVPMVFIRAPYIHSTQGAEILAEVDGRPVAARQGHCLATAFHPELTGDDRVHRYFLGQMVHPT